MFQRRNYCHLVRRCYPGKRDLVPPKIIKYLLMVHPSEFRACNNFRIIKHACLSANGPCCLRIVSGNHNNSDACSLAIFDCIRHLRPGRVFNANEADKYQITNLFHSNPPLPPFSKGGILISIFPNGGISISPFEKGGVRGIFLYATASTRRARPVITFSAFSASFFLISSNTDASPSCRTAVHIAIMTSGAPLTYITPPDSFLCSVAIHFLKGSNECSAILGTFLLIRSLSIYLFANSRSAFSV